MGGCRYRVSLKKCPGPQTGVHLREVSASGGSTVFRCDFPSCSESAEIRHVYSFVLKNVPVCFFP